MLKKKIFIFFTLLIIGIVTAIPVFATNYQSGATQDFNVDNSGNINGNVYYYGEQVFTFTNYWTKGGISTADHFDGYINDGSSSNYNVSVAIDFEIKNTEGTLVTKSLSYVYLHNQGSLYGKLWKATEWAYAHYSANSGHWVDVIGV